MDTEAQTIVDDATTIFQRIVALPVSEHMAVVNQLRRALHEYSPMKEHPVDCVLWVNGETVIENDYNPNAVAPPEMALLHTSIKESGYTQPIVVWPQDDGNHVVVDGAHRRRIGTYYEDIHEQLQGYLPVTIIRSNMTDEANRIAATVYHNRARGEHDIVEMQALVTQLVTDVGMSDRWIMQHFGMCADELLRLKQLTGLAALFRDKDFSLSWEVGKGNT